jgi:hypothetical protein
MPFVMHCDSISHGCAESRIAASRVTARKRGNRTNPGKRILAEIIKSPAPFKLVCDAVPQETDAVKGASGIAFCQKRLGYDG